MVTAVVISLGEPSQDLAKTQARQQLNEHFDLWLDALEEQVEEGTPNLEQSTQAVFAMRQDLTGMITKVLVAQKHAQTLRQQWTSCPQCGRPLRARESVNRAVEVLDYYPCSDHLHNVASVQLGDDPLRGREWVEASLALLFLGRVDSVIEDLEKMNPRNAQASGEIRKLASYLRNNEKRLNHGFAHKWGYPIGSECLESAHKFIGHSRLKRSGAW